MATMTREQIKAEAMKLNAVDRESLADELLSSIDERARGEIESAWLAEVDRRERAFAEGKSGETPVGDVLERLRRKGRA